ncbi:hypothetical protein V6M85_03160 [Sulfolobus tengchongensis]|uniref:CRISPR-associated protein Cas5 n=1 Tax=Sulfolobus tengchongensis TaxID=207809 RepID=A0AAX4L2H4_9CREN
MSSPIVVVVEVEFFSNFSLLPPLVVQSQGYPVPPPTTLVGALAYPYFRLQGREVDGEYSIAKKLVEDKKVLYASFYSPLYVVNNEIERVFTLFVQKKERLRKIKDTNKIIECIKKLSSDKDYVEKYLKYLELISMSSQKKDENLKKLENELKNVVKECFDYLYDSFSNAYSIGSRSSVYYGGSAYIAYIITDPEIIKYSYGIVRVGRKESLVYVKDVSVYSLKDIIDTESDRVKTRFYFPVSLAINYFNCEKYDLPILNINNYKSNPSPETNEFCVPSQLSLNPILVDVNLEKAYVLNLRNERKKLIVPKEVVEYA